VKLIAVVAFPFNVPTKLPKIVPAEKLHCASRRISDPHTAFDVAEFASDAPSITLIALNPPTEVITVFACVPVTSPPSVPVKLFAVVAVPITLPTNVPIKLAVIVPAAKLQFESRITIDPHTAF